MLNSDAGVDQTLETFDKDVSDRFRRRLPDDMNQVQLRRARSTPAIMKELRYGIFPGVNRFKACYLAVLRLKMTGHPTPEQLIGAAKAKYNSLNPYDGLNASVSVKLPCPPLSNWRILKEIDRFGGGATVVALAGTAAHRNPTAPGASQAEAAELDPLSLGNNDDGERAHLATDGNDDGDGSAPLSSTFSRGKKSVFQERHIGCKAAKAATRAVSSHERGGRQHGRPGVARPLGGAVHCFGVLVNSDGSQLGVRPQMVGAGDAPVTAAGRGQGQGRAPPTRRRGLRGDL